MDDKGISLYQLNKQIQDVVRNELETVYWIKTEIAQIKENFSGHCYLELVDKDAKSDKILAQAKANIWNNTYRILKAYFKTTTRRELEVGMKILIAVRVDFHEIYGLSLNITDIDPAFTVGDLALRKTAIIKQLQDEGVFDMNREQELAMVPQRIAVISSETAAGYTDFMAHLDENPAGYKLHTKLFPATMQGDKAEDSIIDALNNINDELENFDAVVIIRGGGSQLDLSCFDNYNLACNVAQFPLPVITGIGHEQDDSITDMVAHTRLKTPTAVAAFLIDAFSAFDEQLIEKQQLTIELANSLIEQHNEYLEDALQILPSLIKDRMHSELSNLNNLVFKTSKVSGKSINRAESRQRIFLQNLRLITNKFSYKNDSRLESHTKHVKNLINSKLKNETFKLESYQNISNLADPQHILKQGFSITMHNGKPISTSNSVKQGDKIETILHAGKLISEVEKTES